MEKTFLINQLKNHIRTYDNIRNILTGQRDECTTGSLLDYSYLKDYYKIIVIDLSKKQVFDADPRAIQQVSFTGNLCQRGGTTMFFFSEEAKETILDFSQGSVKVL